MATLVCFHAHPDDESIGTGGTIAKAVRDGHRVVLVFGTKGEHGEVDDGFLDDEEELWQRRVVETHRSAEVLGAERVEFLGYVDSGMMGTPENDQPQSFWTADVEDAAGKLAAILRDESADILTIYDSDGGYGHPDHIQVHRVGVRAAEMAGVEHVYEMTMNRDHLRRLLEAARANGTMNTEELPDIDAEQTFGRPESVITTGIDVREFIDVKKASMRAHASQIAETSFFLSMPDDAFLEAFGWEWFIRQGAPADHRDDDLFAFLESTP
jgi:LmbE family N-acetylglucosaminyl deacetylase